MTAERFFRELAWPATDMAVLPAIVAFALLTRLADAAGMFGVWLGVILAPALFRYLLLLLEARAYGRRTPVASVELFSIVENFWSLSSLVIVAILVWGGLLLGWHVSMLAAQVFCVLMLAILPASLAVLAITRSPIESLNPAAIAGMIRACGPRYALAPLALATAGAVVALLSSMGAPDIIVTVAGYYALFLLFTATGGLLHASGVQFSLSPDDAASGDPAAVIDLEDRARRQVLNHAYGFFSRGNRAGAMAHISAALERAADHDEAWRWYFKEMLKWESKDGALLLAQSYLARLLAEQRDVEAVKLISRCLLVNPAFRPAAADLDAALAVAHRLDREDLIRTLQV